MIEQQKNVFCLNLPNIEEAALPLIFDSPHSGLWCPEDFDSIAPVDAIKTSWDAYVDELWDTVPLFGGTLLSARFHRAYIDPNRSDTDIDLELLEEPWPNPVCLSERSLRGMGLIRRYALPGVPMYGRKLSVSEVERRIANYYLPYHCVLKNLIDQAHARFKKVWHVNCHSMKSVGNAMNSDNGGMRPDFVISDCDGASTDPTFTRWVAERLHELGGYSVNINFPYHGGEIIRKYSDPSCERYSIQIEINRRLYMNEETCEKNEGFDVLKQNLETFVLNLGAYVNSKLIDR